MSITTAAARAPKNGGEKELQQQQQQQQPADVVAGYIAAWRAGMRDIDLARDKYRALLESNGRHGDLQVAMGALRRALESTYALLSVEEVK